MKIVYPDPDYSGEFLEYSKTAEGDYIIPNAKAKPSPKVLYLKGNYSAGPQHILDKEGLLSSDDYIVEWTLQSMTSRTFNENRVYPKIREFAPKNQPKFAFSFRPDLFFNTGTSRNPNIDLDNWQTEVEGPVWDFIPTGDVPSPRADMMLQTGADVDMVEDILRSQGYKNVNMSKGPFGFVYPYYPYLSSKGNYFYNNQKADITNPKWQETIVDYVSRATHFDACMFQFVKPQQYAPRPRTKYPNANNPLFSEWAISSSVSKVVETPVSFLDVLRGKTYRWMPWDHMGTNSFEWFIGLRDIFYMLRKRWKKELILDFNYFGISVWRYAKNIIVTASSEYEMSIEDCAIWFYNELWDMAKVADRVNVNVNGEVANKDPRYAVPDWFKKIIRTRPRVLELRI